MSGPVFCDQIAKERNCSPELVRAIISEYLGQLHEAAYKGGSAISQWKSVPTNLPSSDF